MDLAYKEYIHRHTTVKERSDNKIVNEIKFTYIVSLLPD